MKTTICRTYRFEAAHQLRDVPIGHKCANMHGHTYRVDVRLTGDPKANGMVRDFAELDLVLEAVVRPLDHHVLNHVKGLEHNPTAEAIAEHIGRQLRSIWQEPLSVRVYENPDCWAEVSL